MTSETASGISLSHSLSTVLPGVTVTEAEQPAGINRRIIPSLMLPLRSLSELRRKLRVIRHLQSHSSLIGSTAAATAMSFEEKSLPSQLFFRVMS